MLARRESRLPLMLRGDLLRDFVHMMWKEECYEIGRSGQGGGRAWEENRVMLMETKRIRLNQSTSKGFARRQMQVCCV